MTTALSISEEVSSIRSSVSALLKMEEDGHRHENFLRETKRNLHFCMKWNKTAIEVYEELIQSAKQIAAMHDSLANIATGIHTATENLSKKLRNSPLISDEELKSICNLSENLTVKSLAIQQKSKEFEIKSRRYREEERQHVEGTPVTQPFIRTFEKYADTLISGAEGISMTSVDFSNDALSILEAVNKVKKQFFN